MKGLRSTFRGGKLVAGWRRAERLSGRGAAAASPASIKTPSISPLDSGEKSAIFDCMDAAVPTDRPPSSVDSPLSTTSRRGLSATGIAFDPPSPPSQLPVTSPGPGVTPPGLTS